MGFAVGSVVGRAVDVVVGADGVGVVVGTDVGCNGDMQTVKPARFSGLPSASHVIIVPGLTGTRSASVPTPSRTPE